MAALLPILFSILAVAASGATAPVAPAPASSTPPPLAAPSKAPPSTPVPSNLTAIMSNKGCKSFASLLNAVPGVVSTFEDVIIGGLTVFCPSDRAVSAFMPQYKNLTTADKTSLLLYHGMPVYNSLNSLKTSNGVMNTLATDGTNKNFNVTVQDDGDLVSLKTGVATSSISSTAFDDGKYLAVYVISGVLQPVDIFKIDEPPSPAPEPAPKSKPKKKTPHEAAPPPADAPEGAAADDQRVADDSSRIAWPVVAQVAAVAGVMLVL